MLLDLHDTATRLLDDAGAVTVPLLVLAAGSDWVVHESAQRRFVERASSPVKRFEVLPGFSHAVFHERGRQVRERIGDQPLPGAMRNPRERDELEPTERTLRQQGLA